MDEPFASLIPASLPNVISGLKQGWSFAWRALMAGKMQLLPILFAK